MLNKDENAEHVWRKNGLKERKRGWCDQHQMAKALNWSENGRLLCTKMKLIPFDLTLLFLKIHVESIGCSGLLLGVTKVCILLSSSKRFRDL